MHPASAARQSLALVREQNIIPHPGRNGPRIRWSNEEWANYDVALVMVTRERLHQKTTHEELATLAMQHMARARSLDGRHSKRAGEIKRMLREGKDPLAKPDAANDQSAAAPTGAAALVPELVDIARTAAEALAPPANARELVQEALAESTVTPEQARLDELAAIAQTSIAEYQQRDLSARLNDMVEDGASLLTQFLVRGIGDALRSPELRRSAYNFWQIFSQPEHKFQPELDITEPWVEPKIGPRKQMVLIAGLVSDGPINNVIKEFGKRLALRLWRSSGTLEQLRSDLESCSASKGILIIMSGTMSHKAQNMIQARGWKTSNPERRLIMIPRAGAIPLLHVSLEELAQKWEKEHASELVPVTAVAAS